MSAIRQDKVAVITGGSTGIGRAVAVKFASQGVRVVLAGRDPERGNATAAALVASGGEALFVQTDVSKEAEIKNLVEQALSHYGRVDYLFNNAGTEGALGPLETNTEEIIDEVLAVNIKGVVLCIKHIMPVMIKQGSGIIINTASFVGTTMPLPIAVVYGASKSAVISITQSVAVASAEHGIDVFAVCPWVTDTPMVDRLTGHQAEEKAGFGATINPSGKIATAEDIADVVLSLFIAPHLLQNGVAVLVDSGGSMKKIVPMVVE